MTDRSLVSQLSSANTAFGLSLYRQVCDGHDGNVFLSPFSISTSLAMTFVGARGSTAQQMTGVLQWPAKLPVAQAFHQYLDCLASSAGPLCQLLTANRIYLNAGSHFLQEFLDTTRKHFQTENTLANFTGDPDGERVKINEWVEEVTRQKIKDAFGPGTIQECTKVVLVNAIYFKGSWASPFTPGDTSKGKFKLANGKNTDCDMMNLIEDLWYGMNEEHKFSIVDLRYSGNSLRMAILLPEKEDGLKELEKSLTPDLLSAAVEQTEYENVHLQLPKFTVENGFKLNEVLSRLGMEDVFEEGKADLSGMNGGRDLFLSQVVHKAFVEVNEEGTEAAAFTGNVCDGGPRPCRKFIADHPFLFFIRDVKSDMILFMGRLMTPEKP